MKCFTYVPSIISLQQPLLTITVNASPVGELGSAASPEITETNRSSCEARSSAVLMADSTSVRVAVRVRPLNAREKVDRCSECVNVLEEETQVIIGKQRSFTYDYVFGQYCAQTDIMEQVRRIILNERFPFLNVSCSLNSVSSA